VFNEGSEAHSDEAPIQNECNLQESSETDTGTISSIGIESLRRSTRTNKGVPPAEYGDQDKSFGVVFLND
jgi:hypothetical protein